MTHKKEGKKVKITSLRITDETREKLNDIGRKGQSYEEIIINLIKERKGQR